ncbi:hypothetical protein B566_EDAN003758 [Ephemera danica]|nr:hypothetical protein B566_EDAN003758 [Ephemera danica]
MSASPIARQATQSQSIPSRHVVINDASQLPMDYSTTPGGTLFSTTPGGTRIVYDRSFLLQLRNSPVARTPPKNLPVIPGITTDAVTAISPLMPLQQETRARSSSSWKSKMPTLLHNRHWPLSKKQQQSTQDVQLFFGSTSLNTCLIL